MALTRAQLLMGNSGQGTPVLNGQVQGVKKGAGIAIATDGTISVDASTVTGLVKLNGGIYNSYVWPNTDGAADTFLKTDGSGNLSWATTQGFAVVTVSPLQPSPTDEGELWFDCNTGTLKVFQSCVAPAGWTSVAQPGKPVLPGNTTAFPNFSGGLGTSASPYVSSVTTVGSGGAVFVVNVVTISGLAPNQYVPIIDLNAVTNGGRFSFSNYYANGSGDLVFQTIFNDAPPSPSGTNYTAAIKVGYGSVYIDAVVNVVSAMTVTGGSITGPAYSGNRLTYTPGTPSGGSSPYTTTYQWFRNGVAIGSATNLTYDLVAADVGANITAKTLVTDNSGQSAEGTSNSIGPINAAAATLTVTSAGSIAPSASVSVGQVLTYTAGTFTGGVPTVTPSWVWKRAGVAITGTANAPTYPTVSADAGQAITVTYTVTDSATPTANTASLTTTSVTPTTPFPPAVWNPTPSGAMNSSNPGTSSGTWNGPAGTVITATGCVEVSKDGTNFFPSVTVTNPDVLSQRWKQTPGCGLGNSGSPLNGTVTDGTNTNSYSLTINRQPSPAIADISDTLVPLGGVTTKAIAAPVNGLNSPAYVTLGTGSTGTSIQASTDNITFTAVPSAPSLAFPVSNGQTLYIRQTVGGSTNVGYTAVIRVGDSDGVLADQFTYTATTVLSAALPISVYNPTSGRPNATPATTNIVGESLNGTVSTTWGGTEASTTLTPASGLLIGKNGGVLGTTPVTVTNSGTDTVQVAFDPTYIATVANTGTASKTFTATYLGTNYTNTFSYTVDKNPTWAIPAPVTGAALSTQQTTGALPVTAYNSPVTVSFSNPTTASSVVMDNVQASVNSGPPTNITVGTTTVTLNPGQTLEVLGDTGGTNDTNYGVTVTVGSATAQEWLVKTTNVLPTIVTPTAGPTGGPLNPAANTPAGITLTGSTYTPATGAPGPHTDTDWELYKGSFPLTSTNAITTTSSSAAGSWSVSTPAPSFPGQVNDVAYGNGVWVAVGTNNGIMSSSDGGATWTQRTSGLASSTTFKGVTYANGAFITVGTPSGIAPSACVSSDGSTWATASIPVAAGTEMYGIAYKSGTWIAGGDSGIVAYSTNNGVTWTSAGTASVPGILCAAVGNGLFVVSGGNGKVAYSSNGISWTDSGATLFSGGTVAGIAYGNGIFMATKGDAAATSPDAAVWTSVTGPGLSYQNNGNATGFGGGSWYASGDDGLNDRVAVSSDNGTTWTRTTISGWPGANTLTGIDFSIVENKWMVGGSSGATATQTASSQSITIAGCQTDGFLVGETVVSDPAAAGPATITAVSNTSVTVAPQSASWATGQKIKRATSSYSQIVNVTNDTTNLTSYLVAEALLTTSSTYYARVRYGASSTSTESAWSNYASFTTASAFIPAPGTAMGGGYFGGQINDGGIIYNLIVAPKSTGQYNPSGTNPDTIQYKNASSADTPSTTFQNQVYGFPASQAGNDANHPAFQFARGLSFSGYNDWYIPAKNELEILYYNLKPTTAPPDNNSTTSGINPNAVPARSSNYTSSVPGQTASTLFQSTGAQAFSTVNSYWTSTEFSTGVTQALVDSFANGSQAPDGKLGTYYARAIRREYANAPVAIGAAFGGGYFAGQYVDGSTTYNLILAPIATGRNASVQYKTSDSSDTNPPSQNSVYGGTATNTFNDPLHPAFQWAKGLTIATFSDWYIPSIDELFIVMYNLGQDWTTATAFQAGGSERIPTGSNFWSSTESSADPTKARYTDGVGTPNLSITKSNAPNALAVRRVVA